jgi:hypothetical protein
MQVFRIATVLVKFSVYECNETDNSLLTAVGGGTQNATKLNAIQAENIVTNGDTS